MLPRIIEEAHHLRPNDGVNGIVGTEKHNVVGLYVGEGKLQSVVGMVFIKDVFRIVLFVEERQGDGRL